MFTRAFFTTLMVGFLAVGCASKKPKNAQDGAATGAEGDNAGMTLELNGDSDSGKAGGLQTVYFAFDSSNLDREAKQTLSANAEYLKANQNVDVQIEGHTDERGGRQYNLALGERRAKSVRDYLVALGVKAQRLTTISYGSERPKAEGSDETSWAQNRRANFVVTAK
ncbi:MAG: peptidoglycan-associated lipoprotein Pal [Bacteriovoracia bacterium]